MFLIDHLMVEVDDPLKAANHVMDRLDLPLAWPLMKTDGYTSIGVNFGDINIEFIKFRIRFGVGGTSFRGFSGIAFKTIGSLEDATKKLNELNLSFRIGESVQAHTTLPVEEGRIFPTIFLVKYHFDTSGWRERLRNEFDACGGGNFRIGKFKSLSIGQTIPANMASEFKIDVSNKNQIFFESLSGNESVISDLIENLELVIG